MEACRERGNRFTRGRVTQHAPGIRFAQDQRLRAPLDSGLVSQVLEPGGHCAAGQPALADAQFAAPVGNPARGLHRQRIRRGAEIQQIRRRNHWRNSLP